MAAGPRNRRPSDRRWLLMRALRSSDVSFAGEPTGCCAAALALSWFDFWGRAGTGPKSPDAACDNRRDSEPIGKMLPEMEGTNEGARVGRGASTTGMLRLGLGGARRTGDAGRGSGDGSTSSRSSAATNSIWSPLVRRAAMSSDSWWLTSTRSGTRPWEVSDMPGKAPDTRSPTVVPAGTSRMRGMGLAIAVTASRRLEKALDRPPSGDGGCGGASDTASRSTTYTGVAPLSSGDRGTNRSD
mmetsp:Transcript_8406/g.25223  ORF Transcript_8406/g.25223 Transcript_8406/m.25223 type:complete len:242 (-) Transcript_8406:1945-2670(-)